MARDSRSPDFITNVFQTDIAKKYGITGAKQKTDLDEETARKYHDEVTAALKAQGTGIGSFDVAWQGYQAGKPTTFGQKGTQAQPTAPPSGPAPAPAPPPGLPPTPSGGGEVAPPDLGGATGSPMAMPAFGGGGGMGEASLAGLQLAAPSRLRAGIGQRNPPTTMSPLAGLRSIY